MTRIIQAFLLSLVVALVMAGGCTEPPINNDGAGRAQTLPTNGFDASGMFDSEASVPNPGPGFCAPDGVFCNVPKDCCSRKCDNHACVAQGGSPIPGSPFCIPPGVHCEESQYCCAGNASEGYCGMGICGNTPSGACIPSFVRCTTTMDCCFPESEGSPGQLCVEVNNTGVECTGSQTNCACNGPVHPGAPPLCVPYGLPCHEDTDCCVGKCSENLMMSPPVFACDVPL